MSQRTAYIEKMELQLAKLNTKMSELESDAQDAKEAAREKHKEEMSKLRQQSKVAVAKLDELKVVAEDSWEGMVSEMEKLHDAYTHSFFSMFQIPAGSWSHLSAEKPAATGKAAAHKKG